MIDPKSRADRVVAHILEARPARQKVEEPSDRVHEFLKETASPIIDFMDALIDRAAVSRAHASVHLSVRQHGNVLDYDYLLTDNAGSADSVTFRIMFSAGAVVTIRVLGGKPEETAAITRLLAEHSWVPKMNMDSVVDALEEYLTKFLSKA